MWLGILCKRDGFHGNHIQRITITRKLSIASRSHPLQVKNRKQTLKRHLMICSSVSARLLAVSLRKIGIAPSALCFQDGWSETRRSQPALLIENQIYCLIYRISLQDQLAWLGLNTLYKADFFSYKSKFANFILEQDQIELYIQQALKLIWSQRSILKFSFRREAKFKIHKSQVRLACRSNFKSRNGKGCNVFFNLLLFKIKDIWQMLEGLAWELSSISD